MEAVATRRAGAARHEAVQPGEYAMAAWRPVFEPSQLLIHGALLVGFLLYRFLGVHLALASIPFLVALGALILWRPRWVSARSRALDRDLLRLAQLGKTRDLEERYRGELLLRFLASRSYLAEKLGFVHAELGHHAEAARWYRRAAQTADLETGRRLRELLAAQESAAGNDAEAEGLLSVLTSEGRVGAPSAALLGRLLVEKDTPRAIRLLQRATSDLPPGQQRAQALRALTRAYHRSGDAERTVETLRRAAADLQADDLQGRTEQEALLSLVDGGSVKMG